MAADWVRPKSESGSNWIGFLSAETRPNCLRHGMRLTPSRIQMTAIGRLPGSDIGKQFMPTLDRVESLRNANLGGPRWVPSRSGLPPAAPERAAAPAIAAAKRMLMGTPIRWRRGGGTFRGQ
jgi:hypothetical protein